MRLFFLRKLLPVSAGMVALASPCHGAISLYLDDFLDQIDESGSILLVPNGGSDSAIGTQTTMTVPNGPANSVRTTTLTRTPSSTGGAVGIVLIPPSDPAAILAVSIASSTTAVLEVDYTFDAFDATSSNLFDTIEFGIDASSDADGDDSMSVSFTSAGGGTGSRQITLFDGTNPVTGEQQLSMAADFGGVDFSMLTGMNITITGNKLDFGITGIGTLTVPEPSTVLMLMLGMWPVIIRRRS